MAIVSVIGSKGGVGTSLVATNVAAALAISGMAVLVDLHLGVGVDDLLLDSSVSRTWTELLPVLDELQLKHIKLATSVHSSGLKLMRGPESWTHVESPNVITKLIQSLTKFFEFNVIDLQVGLTPVNRSALSISDVTLLVTSPDPPALSCAKRFIDDIEPESAHRLGLVINQINHLHPSTAGEIAESLELPLLASLPPDPRAVGYQIHFGQVCVQDPSSMFGRGIRRLTARLQQSATRQIKSTHFSTRGLKG